MFNVPVKFIRTKSETIRKRETEVIFAIAATRTEKETKIYLRIYDEN
jgi:hypothetical protein